MRGDGQGREQTAEGQGSGIAHEDGRGIRVVPQEAETGHGRTGGDDGQVKRIGNRIGEPLMPGTLQMVELPEGHDRVTDEGDHRRAGGQTVQTIRQINGVRPCGHEEVHPNHEQHDGHHTTGELKAEKRAFDEADARLRARETGLGGQNQRKHRVDGGKNELTDELAPHGQALALLLTHLGEVIDESEHAHRQHGEQHQHRRPGRHLVLMKEAVQRRRAPSQHDGQVDDHTAQCRRAALDQMRLRSVLTNVLSVIELMH